MKLKDKLIEDWIEEHIELSFSRSGGPGGQNVNRLNTKVTARLSVSEQDKQSGRIDCTGGRGKETVSKQENSGQKNGQTDNQSPGGKEAQDKHQADSCFQGEKGACQTDQGRKEEIEEEG